MARQVFYATRIAGRRFEGVLGASGPELHVFSGRTEYAALPLGPDAVIAEAARGGRAGVWICNGHEPVVDLGRFNEDDVREIIARFGIRLDHPDMKDSFHASEAWAGLREFVASHPRRARAAAEARTALGDWLGAALAENAAEDRTAPSL